jgi:hypothetical protein
VRSYLYKNTNSGPCFCAPGKRQKATGNRNIKQTKNTNIKNRKKKFLLNPKYEYSTKLTLAQLIFEGEYNSLKIKIKVKSYIPMLLIHCFLICSLKTFASCLSFCQPFCLRGGKRRGMKSKWKLTSEGCQRQMSVRFRLCVIIFKLNYWIERGLNLRKNQLILRWYLSL